MAGGVLAAVLLAGTALVAQVGSGSSDAPSTAPNQVVPRTPDGRPDLSGVWEHNAATPMERPDELQGRAELTDQELEDLKRAANQIFGQEGADAAFGDTVYRAALRNVLEKEKNFSSTDEETGNYNAFWVVDRWFEKRTSLVTDPADGKLPALTADARMRQQKASEYRRAHPNDGPENLPVGLRCITGRVPMLGAGYNNYYQIIQSPSVVAVNMEMRHDARLFPIGDRPHPPSDVKLWLGHPVARWEGDTLVVESTNFRDDESGRNNISANGRMIERFTRLGPETLKYEVTVEDPTMYERPWTAVAYWKKTTDHIYEYACHEGNYSMEGTLAGARADEKRAASAGNSSTR
jgi:hypothetical protein